MVGQFKQLRGYDPIPWLPVLTGRVVQSAEASDRFLWDFRKTIGDLIANEHYGQLEATLHERGMGHYGESHEGGRAFVADGMEVKKFNEVPMSAMWTQTPGVNKEQYGYNADDRESASVAHIYGQNIAAAESLPELAGIEQHTGVSGDENTVEGAVIIVHCPDCEHAVGPLWKPTINFRLETPAFDNDRDAHDRAGKGPGLHALRPRVLRPAEPAASSVVRAEDLPADRPDLRTRG